MDSTDLSLFFHVILRAKILKTTLVYIVFLQIISAAETLTLHPSSKIAKENLDVFCEAWESQISDMTTLLREINDVFEGRRGERLSTY